MALKRCQVSWYCSCPNNPNQKNSLKYCTGFWILLPAETMSELTPTQARIFKGRYRIQALLPLATNPLTSVQDLETPHYPFFWLKFSLTGKKQSRRGFEGKQDIQYGCRSGLRTWMSMGEYRADKISLLFSPVLLLQAWMERVCQSVQYRVSPDNVRAKGWVRLPSTTFCLFGRKSKD